MSTRSQIRQVLDGRCLELGRHGVQAAVIATYEAIGCTVARMAQSYRRGKRLNPGTPGVPDLYVFPPTQRWPGPDLMHRWAPFWHETKAPKGKQSPEQIQWQLQCEHRGVAYVVGGVLEACAHLKRLGLIA